MEVVPVGKNPPKSKDAKVKERIKKNPKNVQTPAVIIPGPGREPSTALVPYPGFGQLGPSGSSQPTEMDVKEPLAPWFGSSGGWEGPFVEEIGDVSMRPPAKRARDEEGALVSRIGKDERLLNDQLAMRDNQIRQANENLKELFRKYTALYEFAKTMDAEITGQNKYIGEQEKKINGLQLQIINRQNLLENKQAEEQRFKAEAEAAKGQLVLLDNQLKTIKQRHDNEIVDQLNQTQLVVRQAAQDEYNKLALERTNLHFQLQNLENQRAFALKYIQDQQSQLTGLREDSKTAAATLQIAMTTLQEMQKKNGEQVQIAADAETKYLAATAARDELILELEKRKAELQISEGKLTDKEKQIEAGLKINEKQQAKIKELQHEHAGATKQINKLSKEVASKTAQVAKLKEQQFKCSTTACTPVQETKLQDELDKARNQLEVLQTQQRTAEDLARNLTARLLQPVAPPTVQPAPAVQPQQDTNAMLLPLAAVAIAMFAITKK
jgi:chromosome segregation ATPase